MNDIEFKNISKVFDKTVVIENLDLTIKDGEFTVLVGPSGCGKTTLLRMIAGIGPQTSGEVLIGGRDVTNTPPGKRGVAMVFQNYAIYPTMRVRENIEFGLKNNKVPKQERDQLVSEISEIVGLSDYLDRMPGTLSGGQRQRVALARAMVKKPKVFLMDEPLSNLDAKLRTAMRIELIELHKRLKTTFIYVTHDQIEAMSMADTIVLMNNGVIQQKGSPESIYYDMNNLFTATFIGSPQMNIINTGIDGIKFGFRPEKVYLSYTKPEDSCFVKQGIISTREMLGSETVYKIVFGDSSVLVKSFDNQYRTGQTLYFYVSQNDIYLFNNEGNRIRNTNSKYAECFEIIRGVGI